MRTIDGHARAASVLAVSVLAVVFALSACGSSIDGRAVAKPVTVPATSSATSPATPRTTPEVPEGGDVDLDVEIGDCVKLGGDTEEATIDNAVCGSFSSNFKVVAKVPNGDLCSPDVDQYYYETLRGVEQGALCLDVDWVIGGCMELGRDNPARIDCDEPAVQGLQVIDIVQGTDDASVCEDSAYVYDDRKTVVCVLKL